MSDLICPQCRLSNCHDCREPECPGARGFVPLTWQRPIHVIAQDLERYESLILQCDEHFASPNKASNIALTVGLEAQAIRAKHQKEAAKTFEDGDRGLWRVGKKNAGRLLQGHEHNEFPKLEGSRRL